MDNQKTTDTLDIKPPEMKFYLGRDGEYYYNDGRPFPHPYTAKGIIALCTGGAK